MVQPSNKFTGLSMPVFAAFGWAGEENAIKYALSQLELFIAALHGSLPRTVQERLPVYGLSRESQSVYLAAGSKVDEDIHIAFYARPMSMEIQLAIVNKQALEKALRQAEKEPLVCHRHITELGPEWSLRLQQMQVDDETGEKGHYQDLFKESVSSLDEETAVNIFQKAAYLNSEERWITPIYLSRRISSEQIAAMGIAITRIVSDQITALLPLLVFFSGRAAIPSKGAKTKTKNRARTKDTAPLPALEVEEPAEASEGFTYVAELKPLHVKKGFVNLTPRHWPFFEINSRTETRLVTVYYEGLYDKNCAIWRLQPDNQARLVLSPTVHAWLEENAQPDDRVQLVARKLTETEIQVSLKLVE